MKLLSEKRGESVTVRVMDCGCGSACETRLVFASTREDLWLAVGIVAAEDEVEQIEPLIDNVLVNDVFPSCLIEHGIALFGLRWRELASSKERAVDQLAAFEAAPDWMFRVPIERVWATRRVCFGDDLTRVVRALKAAHDAYDAGGVQTP